MMKMYAISTVRPSFFSLFVIFVDLIIGEATAPSSPDRHFLQVYITPLMS